MTRRNSRALPRFLILILLVAAAFFPIQRASHAAPQLPVTVNQADKAMAVIAKVWPPAKGLYETAKPLMELFGVFSSGGESDQSKVLKELQKVTDALKSFKTDFKTFADAYNKDVTASKKSNILADIEAIESRSNTYSEAVSKFEGKLDVYLDKYSKTKEADTNTVIKVLSNKSTSEVLARVTALSESENLDHFRGLLFRSIVGTEDYQKGVDKIAPFTRYNAALLEYNLKILAALHNAFEIERLALYLRYKSPHSEAYDDKVVLAERFSDDGTPTYEKRLAQLEKIFDAREDRVNAALVQHAIDFFAKLPEYRKYVGSCDVTFFDGTDIKAQCKNIASGQSASFGTFSGTSASNPNQYESVSWMRRNGESSSEIRNYASLCEKDAAAADWRDQDGYLTCNTPLRTAFNGDPAYNGGNVGYIYFGDNTYHGGTNAHIELRQGIAVASDNLAPHEGFLHLHVDKTVAPRNPGIAIGNGGRSLDIYHWQTGVSNALKIQIKATPLDYRGSTGSNRVYGMEDASIRFILYAREYKGPRAYDYERTMYLGLGCVDSNCLIAEKQETHASILNFANGAVVRLDKCGDDPDSVRRACLYVKKSGWRGQ